jgi:Leucine-rich repeat (LRR) protein
VQIADLVQEASQSAEEVKKSDFEQESWSHVTHLDIISDSFDNENILLTFKANSFEHLKSLKTIEIHITHAFELDADTFLGLDNVETLDMSNCARLTLEMFFPALKGESKLPSLENLIMSKISYKLGPITFGYTGLGGYDSLESKTKLKALEISGTRINIIRPFRLPYLKYLEVLNLSYSNIVDISNNLPDVNDFARLKTLDISFAGIPLLSVWLTIGNIQDVIDRHYEINAIIDPFKLLFVPQTVNISGTLPKSLSIKRCTASLKKDLDLHVNHLISKENNLKYIDLLLDCKNFSLNSIISLDLSGNGLQFLHPSILSCIPNMRHLDLSRNESGVY